MPSTTTRGSNQECWEDLETRKVYSDVSFERELNPAEVVTYKKLIYNPITAIDGFTLKDAIYEGVQFDWAAETTYGEWDIDTRSVEFIVYGNDVDNARVKWTKNYKETSNGVFIITVYVNGTRVYSINQDDHKDLAGFFTVPLQGLKTGDVVKFEVKKPLYSSSYSLSPTIAACLEYTSSDGGLNEDEGMLITANQDPDAPRNYYATFYSSTDVYQVTEGVTAYACAVDGSVLKPTAIEDGIIPAGQGVILRLTTEDNTATKKQIALIQTTATGTWSGTNALTGTDEATTLGEKDYALSLGQNGVGFYLWNGKPVGANRAYLTLDGSAAGTKALGFEIED